GGCRGERTLVINRPDAATALRVAEDKIRGGRFAGLILRTIIGRCRPGRQKRRRQGLVHRREPALRCKLCSRSLSYTTLHRSSERARGSHRPAHTGYARDGSPFGTRGL